MVQAWYMDDSNDDQRLEHHRIPPKYISLDELFRQTGVEYFKVNEKDPVNDNVLNSLKKERNYSYEDEITCSEECLPNYHEKLKNFFTEHLHTDEEIRLVLEGSGYFDVRSPTEEWIRIYVTCGDLIIIPAGIYHRFTLDSKNYIKAKRYFIGEPVWTPYNRPADDMPCRKEYLAKMVKGRDNAVVKACHKNSVKAERKPKRSNPVRQLPENDQKISGRVKSSERKKVKPVQPKIPDSKPSAPSTKVIPDAKNLTQGPKTLETPKLDIKPKIPDAEPKTSESFKPDIKPKTSETPKNIVTEPKIPESFRPDTKPKTPDAPKNNTPEPETPESFRPDFKPKTPGTPMNVMPEPKIPESFMSDFKPKTPDTPKNLLPEPKTPESPKPTTPETPKAPEIPKREPPKVPNRRQEPSKTPESPKSISRDDEMLEMQFNRSPGINGAGPRQSQPDPRDLSYAAHEVAKPVRESALSFTQREKSVPSNPDSLEASEEEED